jgi:hypothetical protein
MIESANKGEAPLRPSSPALVEGKNQSSMRASIILLLLLDSGAQGSFFAHYRRSVPVKQPPRAVVPLPPGEKPVTPPPVKTYRAVDTLIALAARTAKLFLPFRVGPHASWAVFKVKDPEVLASTLPKGMQLAESRVLATDESPGMLIAINTFSVSAKPVLAGRRMEIVTLAKSPADDVPRFVVLDVISDTELWDPVHGVREPNAKTIDIDLGARSSSTLYTVSVESEDDGAGIFSMSGRAKSETTDIDNDFAITANKRTFFRNISTPVSLLFDRSAVGKEVRELQSATATVGRLPNQWKRHFGRLSHAFLHTRPMEFWCVVPLSLAFKCNHAPLGHFVDAPSGDEPPQISDWGI